jgi:hypothetical protein
MTSPKKAEWREDGIEKFLLTPAMARLFNSEGLLMATGRLGGYEGKTVRDELKSLISQTHTDLLTTLKEWITEHESYDEWGKENPHIFANELREHLDSLLVTDEKV